MAAPAMVYRNAWEFVAERYRHANCTASGAPLNPSAEDAQEAASRRPQVTALAAQAGAGPAASAAVPRPPACDVYTASYGGQVSLLIRAVAGASVNYTVLQVDGSLEQPQADAYIRLHAPNGRAIARFAFM